MSVTGPVVLVLVPPKEFDKILVSSESGIVEGNYSSALDQDEIVALSKHIEQFLEVLMVFKLPSRSVEVCKLLYRVVCFAIVVLHLITYVAHVAAPSDIDYVATPEKSREEELWTSTM